MNMPFSDNATIKEKTVVFVTLLYVNFGDMT